MVEHDDGVSVSNKVLVSVEDETGPEDQERHVKRRRTCQSGSGFEQKERQNITCLPSDVLHRVLDKLFELVDYVHFAAACKELQFVANEYNHTMQRWLRKPRLLPMLLILPLAESKQSRLVYSVSERKSYNNVSIGSSSVPHDERVYGSSQGWLATGRKSIKIYSSKKTKVIDEITLRNLFGEASEAIHLPPYTRCNVRFKDWIPRVILSANPALHPEDYYLLLVFYRPFKPCYTIYPNPGYPPCALIKGGQESWIEIELIGAFPDDAIFYKNKICLLLERGPHQMVTVDVSDFSTPKIDYIHFKPEGIPASHYWERYLVESTNGDLLLVQRNFERRNFVSSNGEEGSSIPTTYTVFSVCKIVFNESKDKRKFELVAVRCIGDDAIFLGQSQSQSVLASDIPGCKPNCIYYFTDRHRLMEYPMYDHLKSETGIFNLGDRTRTPLIESESLNVREGVKMNMLLWILPSLNL